MENINSGADYANVMIDSIIEMENKLPKEERMPSLLFTYWCQEISNKADETWVEYITGNRETFLMSDVEMKGLYEKAGMRFASDMVNNMVDNDLLETFVDESGDILYGLTEKGKQAVIDNIIKDNE